MSNLVWGFKESNDLFKLKVSGRIREGHRKEVAFDQGSYEIIRKMDASYEGNKWNQDIEGSVVHKLKKNKTRTQEL